MESQPTARLTALFLLSIATLLSSPAFGQRPFTSKDDVGLALFEYAGRAAPGGVIKYSPDGRYFAVVTERGRLDLDAPEDTIWLFRIEDVQRFVQHPGQGNPPTPLTLAQMATDKDGPLIETVRWLPDSSAVAFTAIKRSALCKFHQLFVADVRTHAVKPLTPEDQDVGEFDIRSDASYVYEVGAPQLLTAPREDPRASVVLTGKTLWTILFPDIENRLSPFDAAGLWAVIDGKRRHVLDSKSYEASRFRSSLSLSPDGRSAVAVVKAEHPPETTWARYKAPPGYDKLKIPLDTSAYHLVDLTTGSKKILVNAPYGMNQGWQSYLTAIWSADGHSVLLPGTFFPLDVSDPKEIVDRESHPYVAVLRLTTGELKKVLALKAGLDKERYGIQDARFEDDGTVTVNFDRSYFLPDQPPAATFHEEADGSWRQGAGTEDPRLAKLPFRVEKRESINQPPQFVAEERETRASHVIWDPNPQLKDIELGPAEVIHWKDATGYEWEAGLVKPAGYVPGKRYPLVIQTHGFGKGRFLSSGNFTTAFAARALAAQGIAVLQMRWNPNDFATPKEGLNQVAGFESIVKKLMLEGLIDPSRVGAIGFSRSVYHVLAAITTAEHLFAAASVTDGVTFGYFEYLFMVDGGLDREVDPMNGGKPFGAVGLKNWLAHSPEFNMDKVRTPLLLLQPGVPAAFGGWEPYAALRYLKKPVDLIMLQAGSHVMTNPTQRLASETTNVDWFRFWLKGEEDPDPAKAEQYARWRALRMQSEIDASTARR